MKLYPLGTQRDLSDEFDAADFYGLNWGEGKIRKPVERNRLYSGLLTITNGKEVEVYYYEYCTYVDTFEKEKIFNSGYERKEIQCGRQHPLYLCRDVFKLDGGYYRKIDSERELLPYYVARRLLMEYLDPYYYKPNQALRKKFKKKKGVVT